MADLQDIKGITDTHAEYDRYADRWQRCRDCVDGADAIKTATTRYFPALAGETPVVSGRSIPAVPGQWQLVNGQIEPRIPENPLTGQYEKRLTLATVYEAADKTLDALLGALFRVPSEPMLPDAIVPHTENLDLAGTSYDAFKQQAGAEVLETGRYGVLVDWSVEQRRPFWRPYETEQIDNWLYGVRGGQKVLEQVKLRETITERSASGFGGDVVERYRVLELNEAGAVESTVYTKRRRDGVSGAAWEQDGPTILTRQGVPLTEIPFVAFGRLDADLCPQKPPLLSICDLQLDHYRLDGDIKWAVHIGCMGALFVAGDGEPTDPKTYWFGGAVNRLAAGATAEFVTLKPDMVDRAREEKSDDERRMALLGARMLLAPKREAETAEASLIQRDGESASLSMISHALTTALTRCWGFHATWMGIDPATVGDELNRDFFPHRLTPEEITVQIQLVNEGRMSVETFLENMYAGQITREPEEERARIDAEPPAAEPADAALLDEQVPPDDQMPA